MARILQFLFRFPPIHGVYDTGDGTVYIFGEQHDGEIEDVINHEVLHWAVQKMAGKRASLKLDKISMKTLRA